MPTATESKSTSSDSTESSAMHTAVQEETPPSTPQKKVLGSRSYDVVLQNISEATDERAEATVEPSPKKKVEPSSPIDYTYSSTSGFTEIASEFKKMTEDADRLIESIREEESKAAEKSKPVGRSDDDSFDDDDDSISGELHRLSHVAQEIRALELGLDEQSSPSVARRKEQPREEDPEFSCSPRPARNADGRDAHGGTMLPYDPSVEELRKLMKSAVKGVAPPPPRSRAIKPVDVPFDESVNRNLVIAVVVIWMMVVMLMDHIRSEYLMNDGGVLQHPWPLR